MPQKLTRLDRCIIGAAICVAPIFWFVGFVLWQPDFDPARPLHDAPRFLGLVLFVPVIEELCFRGVLQPYLLRKTSGRMLAPQLSLANVFTSGIFAALHLIRQPLAWSAATFVPSLVFGWFRERTGKTWPAAAMHVYYNFGFFYLFSGL